MTPLESWANNMLKAKFFAALRWFHFHVRRVFKVRGHGISVLVPLHLDGDFDQRAKNWQWLREYWRSNLPGAEVIVGQDTEGTPFSKSVAVNDAASRAHGDIFVIADADTLISAEAVQHCAKEIRDSEKRGWHLWFMPYRKLFRLTKEASARILKSSPKYSPRIAPALADIENTGTFQGTPVSEIGHWYGAMIQIVSRKAFFTVGGWDTRFRGWGCEDHAAMKATDTLYGYHKTLPGPVMHLWHPTLIPPDADDNVGKKRLWTGQTTNEANIALSGRYYWASGYPDRMRKLVDECRRHRRPEKHRHHRHKHTPPCTSY
jgi:hypothetical protein